MEMAYIEELKYSIISSDVKLSNLESRDSFQLRRNNLKITQCTWITKRAVIDRMFTVYNPKTIISIDS